MGLEKLKSIYSDINRPTNPRAISTIDSGGNPRLKIDSQKDNISSFIKSKLEKLDSRKDNIIPMINSEISKLNSYKDDIKGYTRTNLKNFISIYDDTTPFPQKNLLGYTSVFENIIGFDTSTIKLNYIMNDLDPVGYRFHSIKPFNRTSLVNQSPLELNYNSQYDNLIPSIYTDMTTFDSIFNNTDPYAYSNEARLGYGDYAGFSNNSPGDVNPSQTSFGINFTNSLTEPELVVNSVGDNWKTGIKYLNKATGKSLTFDGILNTVFGTTTISAKAENIGGSPPTYEQTIWESPSSEFGGLPASPIPTDDSNLIDGTVPHRGIAFEVWDELNFDNNPYTGGRFTYVSKRPTPDNPNPQAPSQIEQGLQGFLSNLPILKTLGADAINVSVPNGLKISGTQVGKGPLDFDVDFSPKIDIDFSNLLERIKTNFKRSSEKNINVDFPSGFDLKFPSFGNFKLPSFDLPKFNLPNIPLPDFNLDLPDFDFDGLGLNFLERNFPRLPRMNLGRTLTDLTGGSAISGLDPSQAAQISQPFDKSILGIQKTGDYGTHGGTKDKRISPRGIVNPEATRIIDGRDAKLSSKEGGITRPNQGPYSRLSGITNDFTQWYSPSGREVGSYVGQISEKATDSISGKKGDFFTLFPLEEQVGSDSIDQVLGDKFSKFEMGGDGYGMPFYFQDLRDKKFIIFRGYIEGLTESISPSWVSENYVGRSEPVYVYERATRELSFTLKLFAQTKDEFKMIYKKINKLTSLCYPEYLEDGSTLGQKVRMKPPLTKLRIGDLFGASRTELTGFIRTLNYSVPENSPWETDPATGIAPKHLTVAISYAIVHDRVPEMNSSFYGVN